MIFNWWLGLWACIGGIAAADAKKSDIKKLVISASQNSAEITRLEKYTDLEELEISCLEELEQLPSSIGHLKELRILSLDNGNGCSMNPRLPKVIASLIELRALTLYGAQDPRGTYKAKSLRVRQPLPRELRNLKKLETLNIGRNAYQKVPDVVMGLKSVRTLDLSFNELTDLPSGLLALPQLREIKLNGNFKITCNAAKMTELKTRFQKIRLDFTNEYDCP